MIQPIAKGLVVEGKAEQSEMESYWILMSNRLGVWAMTQSRAVTEHPP